MRVSSNEAVNESSESQLIMVSVCDTGKIALA